MNLLVASIRRRRYRSPCVAVERTGGCCLANDWQLRTWGGLFFSQRAEFVAHTTSLATVRFSCRKVRGSAPSLQVFQEQVGGGDTMIFSSQNKVLVCVKSFLLHNKMRNRTNISKWVDKTRSRKQDTNSRKSSHLTEAWSYIFRVVHAIVKRPMP